MKTTRTTLKLATLALNLTGLAFGALTVGCLISGMWVPAVVCGGAAVMLWQV